MKVTFFLIAWRRGRDWTYFIYMASVPSFTRLVFSESPPNQNHLPRSCKSFLTAQLSFLSQSATCFLLCFGCVCVYVCPVFLLPPWTNTYLSSFLPPRPSPTPSSAAILETAFCLSNWVLLNAEENSSRKSRDKENEVLCRGKEKKASFSLGHA